MNEKTSGIDKKHSYLSFLGALALAFGCSVGWGAFVMPGSTFLPIAGPIGTMIGIFLGALVMLIIALNYHYQINKYPGRGGAYSYTKINFGYDHGFLSAWFLILTYIAIIWANGSALPLIMRTVFGSTFQFGFHYQIAGFDVYLGEILLVLFAFLVGALVVLRKKLAMHTQIILAGCLLIGVVVVFIYALLNNNPENITNTSFSVSNSALGGTFIIFSLAPWAYVGFESISHSAGEAKFSPKKSFLIMALALFASVIAYGFLSLLSVTSLPEGVSSWSDYINNLGNYSGISSQPAFFAASSALGKTGVAVLTVAAIGAIFTGIIGNYIALSRLITSLSHDNLISGWFGKLDKNEVPKNAILVIFILSFALPFLGRTAISWIVDVTTVGATIAFAFTSASAFKTARLEKNKFYMATGIIGSIISLLFALEFLIPNMTSVKTLSTESYLILAAWGILGFIVFWYLLSKDRNRRLGRSTVAWIVLLGLVIFTSTVWMRQATDIAISNQTQNIQGYYNEKLAEAGVDVVASGTKSQYEYLHASLESVDRTFAIAITIQVALIIVALIVLFRIYAKIQRREQEIEVEKLLAEESSRAKTSFLSNMSHEIRTPMNAIIGLDNIALRDPELKPKTREQLEKIGTSAKHLLGLINDILDMSRIESGRMVLKNERFLVREFIEQVNIIINGQCQDKGLDYDCNLIGDLDDYYIGDDLKLKQVLINILGNAVKFTDEGGSVSLSIEEINKENGIATLRFIITDTGIGMDEEYIPKIFEAFSQEDASNTNKYGGSGLGMAITKKFVDLMDGNIEVESTKGVGTKFIVTINLKETKDLEKEDVKLNLKALVVDDDEVAIEHAKIVLEQLGITPTTTISSVEALSLLQKAKDENSPFDLLLTDFRMQNMDGITLTNKLREFDNGYTTVILLTSYGQEINPETIKGANINTIMAKPLFKDNLYDRLTLLEKEKSSNTIETDLSITKNRLSGMRILIAEDVDANAEILGDLLELEDMKYERANNGKVAVEMFNASEIGYYDAILMDVRMPVMDGLTATSEIRKLDREDSKDIPIIAMTANVFDEDVENSMKAGMNAHLNKPIEPEILYAKLIELIYKK